MNLIAIYNVWGDSLELLKGSIEQIRAHVDCICVVAQEKSNAGEIDKTVYPYVEYLQGIGLVDQIIYYQPQLSRLLLNETKKRQLGIDFAKEHGFSHFLHLDSDEYYHSHEFLAAKKIIESDNSIKSSHIDLWTYYKSPELRLKHRETYSVPFIHKVLPNSECGIKFKENYSSNVDPSRAINNGYSDWLTGIFMHHYSYIRLDIGKKLRNSTAQKNINRQDVINEYNNAKEGTHLKALYNDVLIKVPNYFNINIAQYDKKIRTYTA